MIKRSLEKIPRIKAVMTPFPYFVEPEDTLDRARALMQEHELHHLPVQRDRKIVGVLTARDIERVLADPQRKAQPCVSDTPLSDVNLVDLSVPLDRVLTMMFDDHLESVVVVKQGRLAGIFTVMDACRCFAEFLHSIFPDSGGEDAA